MSLQSKIVAFLIGGALVCGGPIKVEVFSDF